MLTFDCAHVMPTENELLTNRKYVLKYHKITYRGTHCHLNAYLKKIIKIQVFTFKNFHYATLFFDEAHK